MRSEELNICIISTPFQLRVLKQVLSPKDRVIIYKTKIISDQDINAYFKSSKIYLFSEHGWSLENFIKEFPKSIYSYRNSVLGIKRSIDENLSKNKVSNYFVNMFIPSEKMIFSQILWSQIRKILRREKLKYIALEEGTRYYVEESTKDFLLKMIYPTLCYLLFGFSYLYYNRLGTSPHIDIAHIRYPEFLPNKRKSVKYVKLTSERRRGFSTEPENDSVLIITTPFSEDGLTSVEREKAFFLKVLGLCKREIKAQNIFVKPHPRENIQKYQGIDDIKLLDGSICVEDMDYFKYKKVINFGSSAILDVITNSYSLEDIYTIESNFFKVKFLKKLFYKTIFKKQNEIE